MTRLLVVLLPIILFSACGRGSARTDPVTLDELTIEVYDTSREIGYTNKEAGFYYTESMKFALLFLAEYANMFAVAPIASVVFLGGWNSPFGDFLSGPILGLFWFLGKGLDLVSVQMWRRWTLPRLRLIN